MPDIPYPDRAIAVPAWARRLPSPVSVKAGIYYVLAGVWVALAAMTAMLGVPNFLDPGNIANVLYQTSFVALLAVPMTLLLISGNFDLSVGANAALCAACVLVLDDKLGPAGAIALTLACGASVGLVNGLIVQRLGINAFIVTLGMMTALRGVLLIVTGGRTATSHNPAGMAVLRSLGTGEWASLAKPVYYLAGVTLLAWFVTSVTIVGRRLQAVGSNVEAARLAGIRVAAYKVVPFVLNGVMAAIVGMLFAARLGSVLPNAMSGLELTVIAAAVLGGTSLFGGSGDVLRSIAGSVLLFSLLNGFDIMGLGSSYQGVVEGVVLVAAAALYAGRREGRT